MCMSESVTFNTAESRYELVRNGHTAYANIHEEGGTLYIDYVFAPPALRGSGAAGDLMQGITDHAVAKGQSVTPICGYAAAWMRKHKLEA